MRVRGASDSYARRAEAFLRQLIVDGIFEPGARLSELEISRKLGVSRSPVREAMQHLANEGLVRLVPNRGAFVTTFDADRLRELYELREALEAQSVRLAAQRASTGDLIELRLMLNATRLALDSAGTYPAELDFHEAIVRLSGNTLLAEKAAEIGRQLRLARVRSARAPERAREAFNEHLAIFESMAQHDPDEAVARLRAHLANAHACAADAVAQAYSRVTTDDKLAVRGGDDA